MAYAMLILVGVLSLIPSPDIGTSDKLMHFVAYFTLSAGFVTLVQANRSLFIVVSGLIGYGILLEFLQGLTGYRMMDGFDMLANSAGVIGGLFIRATAIPTWFRVLEKQILKP